MGEKPRVLFLCTANACRSRIAEALLRHHGGDRYQASSAGLKPTRIDPMTLRVLEEGGIDTSGLRCKGVNEFLGKEKVRHAVVVCEQVQQSCPRLYPFALETLFWPFEDPATFEGSEDERVQKFREVRDLIDDRVRRWLHETT